MEKFRQSGHLMVSLQSLDHLNMPSATLVVVGRHRPVGSIVAASHACASRHMYWRAILSDVCEL